MPKTCNSCNTAYMVVMPVAQHEKDQQRLMSIIKKQIITIIVLICLLFTSFGLFVWYESQFETISCDYTQDGQGTNIIGDSNEVDNGAEIESKNQEETQE